MTVIDYARVLSLCVWGLVFALRAGSSWRVMRGRPAGDDVLWAMVCAFALMVLGFSLRWYIAAGSQATYLGLYAYSTGLGVWSIYLVRQYRRYRGG